MATDVRLLPILAAALASFIGLDATAQGRRAGGGLGGLPAIEDTMLGNLDPETVGAFSARQAQYGAMKARGFLPTGLVPIYPREVACPTLNSAFAASTRGDGSQRERLFFLGYHGGIDIPVPEGTPVLAAADGNVVHKSPGESIGGIGLVIQHAPADTGFPVWIYTEYKHLQRLPEIELGKRVRMGEPVAISGKTGTEGPHYGPGGHPHLHLSAWFSSSDAFDAQRILIPRGGQWMDPLALFRGPPADTPSLLALPAEAKRVAIPYLAADGKPVPRSSKMVWPLPCAPRS